jgi:hypothetical protein
MNAYRHRWTRASASIVLLASLVSPVGIRAHAPDPALSGASWAQDQRLEYRWRAGAEPPAKLRTAIDAAANASNATRASRAAVLTFATNGKSPIGYGPGATCGVNGIACFTRTAPNGGFTMWLREHGRVFEWGVLRWCQMLDTPANGCYDAETIALDEFGHVQGLGHHENHADASDYLDAVVQTVSRTRPKTGWNMHTYGRCDVARLQIRYDVPTASTRLSTCLDLATGLTLAASPNAVAYNGTTTLTATLRVGGSSSYGTLANNALSDRTVQLQRRTPGSTTWTTIGTMATGASAGTYTYRLPLTASAEFRATFAAPAAEGLRAATSGIVGVTAPPCNPKNCILTTLVAR